MNDLHWTRTRLFDGNSLTVHYDVIRSLRGGWTAMVSADGISVRREGFASRNSAKTWLRDVFQAPLNDNSPPERWSFDASLRGLDVKSLQSQIKLADAVMEEILAEERRATQA